VGEQRAVLGRSEHTMRDLQTKTLLRVSAAVAVLVTLGLTSAWAQDPTLLDPVENKGIHAERNYFSPEPWEAFDTVSGNLHLSFTDLVLPGNNGRTLVFQRYYNNQKSILVPSGTYSRWTFGFPGMVMRILDDGGGTVQFNDPLDLGLMLLSTPRFVMADGAVQRAMYTVRPTSEPTTQDWVVTAQFYKYHKPTRTLYMPDGTVCHYNADGLLVDFSDQFNNVVTLSRPDPATLIVTQDLQQGQTRQIVFELSVGLPTRMSYDNRIWEYQYVSTPSGFQEISAATLPLGPGWTFTYDVDGLRHVSTPRGGTVDYEYETNTYNFNPQFPPFSITQLHFRRSSDLPGAPQSTWEISYVPPTQYTTPYSPMARIRTPSGTTVVYENGQLTPLAWSGNVGLFKRTIETSSGVPVETETRTYTAVPTVGYTSSLWWGTPEVTTRTIERAGRTYTTTYAYNMNPLTGNAGNYHHPTSIVETSNGATRTTTLTYQHLPIPYVMGNPLSETTAVNGQSFAKSWTYDTATGFRTTERLYGLQTTFTADTLGNVASVTTPTGKTTTFLYSHGQPSEIQTPMSTIVRTINPDGTVADETRGTRTTSFTYDVLGLRRECSRRVA
jgi:hypothetical protein